MDYAIGEATPDNTIARRWIVANAIALVVGAVCGLAGTGADALLAVKSGDMTTAATIAYWTIQIVLMVIICAVCAKLTAPVLQSIIPALRSDLWLAAHVAIGVVLGAFAGGLGPDNGEPFDWSDLSTTDVVFMALLFVVGGAIIGALFGSVQSMVWRRVARGSCFWIGMAALSGIVMVLIMLPAAPFFLGGGWLGPALVLQSTAMAAGIVCTLMMLPALRRLRPRT